NRAERDQRDERCSVLVRRSAMRGDARSKEQRNPRPERIQLEHVAEIAATRAARTRCVRDSTKTAAAETGTDRPRRRTPRGGWTRKRSTTPSESPATRR